LGRNGAAQHEKQEGNRMREPFASLLNAIASRILTEEVNRTQIHQTNEHIASATQSVAKWTRGLVLVGAVTAGVLVLQYCILRTSDETYRITNRPYVFCRIFLS
jgi:small-conductance mechanosensitive channel